MCVWWRSSPRANKKVKHTTPKQPNTKQAVKPPPFNRCESALTCSDPLIHFFSFALSPPSRSSTLTCGREMVLLGMLWRRGVYSNTPSMSRSGSTGWVDVRVWAQMSGRQCGAYSNCKTINFNTVWGYEWNVHSKLQRSSSPKYSLSQTRRYHLAQIPAGFVLFLCFNAQRLYSNQKSYISQQRIYSIHLRSTTSINTYCCWKIFEAVSPCLHNFRLPVIPNMNLSVCCFVCLRLCLSTYQLLCLSACFPLCLSVLICVIPFGHQLLSVPFPSAWQPPHPTSLRFIHLTPSGYCGPLLWWRKTLWCSHN